MSALLQKSWYRNLFRSKTFIKCDGKWIPFKDHIKGKKIEAVDGKVNTLAFCECGNELVHSDSFIEERKSNTGEWVFDYICSFCGKKQHWNPDIIPGLIPCDEDGTPRLNGLS